MYFTLVDSVRAEIDIKKSRFVAVVARADSSGAARTVVADARKVNSAAGHHCSAFLVGDVPGTRIARSSDDGEPSGTAGNPMLEVLTGHNLTNVVAVVTRFFGGTKLGTGGLTRAYSGAVAEALADARLNRRVQRDLIGVELDHADVGRIESELRGRGITVVSVDYRARAVLTLAVPDAEVVFGVLANLTSGTAEPALLGSEYIDEAV